MLFQFSNSLPGELADGRTTKYDVGDPNIARIRLHQGPATATGNVKVERRSTRCSGRRYDSIVLQKHVRYTVSVRS